MHACFARHDFALSLAFAARLRLDKFARKPAQLSLISTHSRLLFQQARFLAVAPVRICVSGTHCHVRLPTGAQFTFSPPRLAAGDVVPRTSEFSTECICMSASDAHLAPRRTFTLIGWHVFNYRPSVVVGWQVYDVLLR